MERSLRKAIISSLWGLVIILSFLGGSYFAWARALGERSPQLRPVPTFATPGVNIPSRPAAVYLPVLPEVLETLQGQVIPNRTVVIDGIPYIGLYLPRTGLAQFALPSPTAMPTTPSASPTLPALPTSPGATDFPTLTAQPLTPLESTQSPEPTVVVMIVPYGGEEANRIEAVNQDCAPAGMPVNGLLTQRFHAWHSGADLAVPTGTAVVATHSAQVIFAGWSTIGYGYLVMLQSGAFITYYAHLSSFNVAVGQVVSRGMVIGWSGSTGNSSGPHVHYETRLNDVPNDPLTFENLGYATC
jgi:hypothetical protein